MICILQIRKLDCHIIKRVHESSTNINLQRVLAGSYTRASRKTFPMTQTLVTQVTQRQTYNHTKASPLIDPNHNVS